MVKDWSGICARFKGLWVALEDDEVTVITSGKTLKDAYNEAREKGYANPIMMRVPERLEPCISFL
jgi:hypothetical protein